MNKMWTFCTLVALLYFGGSPAEGACQNGGTQSGGGSCNCLFGYSGANCEIELLPEVDCSKSGACKNNQQCVTDPTYGDSCQCATDYTGRLCEINMADDCMAKPCKNGGTCGDDGSGEKRCTCPPNFTGYSCEYFIGFNCAEDKCKNNGVCWRPKPSYSYCFCPAKFVGKQCDQDKPCLAEGNCPDGNGASKLSATLGILALAVLVNRQFF